MSLQQLTVKAHLKRGCQQKRIWEQADEIRRFAVDCDVAANYEYLLAKIASVYPGLVNKAATFYWKDADDDLITFSSDDELMEALKSVSDGIFHVYIVENKTESSGLHGEHKVMASECPHMPFGFEDMFQSGAPWLSAAPPMPPFSGPIACAPPPMPPFMGPMPQVPPQMPPFVGPGAHAPHPLPPFMVQMPTPPPPPARGRAPPQSASPPKPDVEGSAEVYQLSRKAWKRWYKEACGYKHKKGKDCKKKEKKGHKSSSSSSSSDSEGRSCRAEDYLRNVGFSGSAMPNPPGFVVDVDVEHHGQRNEFHRFGMGGPRMRGGFGPWCMRGGPSTMRGRGNGRWGCMWYSANNVASPEAPVSSASNVQQSPSYCAASAAAGSQDQGQQNATHMETGEMASGNFCEGRTADAEGARAGERARDVSNGALGDEISG